MGLLVSDCAHGHSLKWASHEKMSGLPNRSFPMDAEHINQIGATLTDLTARTHELRGYL